LNIGELLDLGHKYLLEANYKEAILTFDKAIAVEAKNPLGYIGAAMADMGLEKQEDAVAVLERGLDAIVDAETGGGGVAEDVIPAGTEYIAALLKLIESGAYSFDLAEEMWQTIYALWTGEAADGESVGDDAAETKMNNEVQGSDNGELITVTATVMSNYDMYADAFSEYQTQYESIGIRSYGVRFNPPIQFESGEFVEEAEARSSADEIWNEMGMPYFDEEGKGFDGFAERTLILTGYLGFDENFMELEDHRSTGMYSVDYLYRPNGPYYFKITSFE
jgi:tetratricopeptide (TPR) repeat protein